MAYTPTNWTNFPSTATPVNANNLNKIENELVALDTGKADESAVTTALEDKVDKVEGKGLSTEDFTTAEKTKLAGISAEANKVEITPVVTEGTTLATISIDGVDTAIKGSDIDVDSTLSLVSNNPVENKTITSTLNNLMENKIAEGNPITIHNASGLSAKSCEVTFPLIQAGSGDPSPENVRPITVWNEVNVYCDTEQTLTPAKTITADLGGSYFSGKVVWNSDGSCKAIIDTKYNLYIGEEEGWAQKGSLNNDNRFTIGITNLKQDLAGESVCNYLKYESGSSGNWGAFRVTGSFFVVKDNGDNFTTANAFKEYLSEHPLQLCYPISTPIEINLSASEIELLSGTNCLWTDGDNIRLVYSTNKADDELSPTSENPLQNKIIYETLQNILPEATAEGNPISITDASGLNAKSCEVTFSPIQSGSGDPSPENIRPISGWDSLVLNQSGANLWDGNYEAGKWINTSTTGEIAGVPGYNVTDYIVVFPDSTMYKSASGSARALFYDKNKTVIPQDSWTMPSSASTFSVPSNAYYARFTVTDLNLSSFIVKVSDSSDGTYYPYETPKNYTATFPDTVYGGSYDFVEGGLSKKWELLDLGARSWVKDTTTVAGKILFVTTQIIPNSGNYNENQICENYKFVGSFTNLTDKTCAYIYGNKIAIQDSTFDNNTAEEFKVAMSGVHLCHKLKTPTEITLTPETIELLKGNNVLWTDGDNITLKYSADIKEWVLAQLQS